MYGSEFYSMIGLSGLRGSYVRALPYNPNFCILLVDWTTVVGNAVAHTAVYALSSLLLLLVFVFSAATLSATRFSAAFILCVTAAITITAPQRR